MYYSEDIVEEVLRANNIVDVVGQYVHLQKKGANYFGLCPFHNEKTPSFSVSEPKQMFYCFGCGAGGSAITFLMKYENCDFKEALQMLADRAHITLPEVNYSEEQKKKQARRQTLLAVNKEAATYYYHLLRSRKGAPGIRYLQKRALTPETINRFGLGFADGASSDLTKHLKQRGYPDDVILASGVASYDEKRGMHDKFWNRVIFPIQDTSNRVIGFGGRVMGDAKPKYLNSPETEIFDKSRNLYGLNIARRTKKPYFILCEGYMDVIAMHQAGFDNAVASLGTSFTQGQAAILKRYVKDVLLAYDSDEAGVRAALRNIRILKDAGLGGRVVDMRPYKDPDEFIKALGADEFQKRLDNAENSFFYELRQLRTQYDMKDPDQRTRFNREIVKKLCEIADDMERDNYIRAVAARYYIDERILRREVASYGRIAQREDAQKESRVADRRSISGISGARERGNVRPDGSGKSQSLLLTALADEPELYRQISRYISPDDFEEGLYRTAAQRFWSRLEKEPSAAAAASVISSFDSQEEQQAVSDMFHTHLKGVDSPREKQKALRDLICSVKRDSVMRLTQSSDPAALGELIRARKNLEDLTKIRIDIGR